MKMRRMIGLLLSALMVLQLTGCGFEKERPLVRVPKDGFEDAAPYTTYVQRGDVTYGKSEDMKLDNYNEIHYGFKAKKLDTTMLKDITFDRLYVSLGDMVRKGDILLTLRSETLDNKIEQYTDQKERNEITIRHLRNRSAIDPEEDNSVQINSCEEDIRIAEGYLAELEEKKEELVIRAEEDGKVIEISDTALSGVVSSYEALAGLVTVASGDDTYYAETKESTTLKEGDITQAGNGVITYDVKVEKVERSSAGNKIYFKIQSDSDDLVIVSGMKVNVAEEVKKDVLYVPLECVKEKDDHYYVFMIDEHGARVAREIKVDEILDKTVIIREGLNEGDEIISR